VLDPDVRRYALQDIEIGRRFKDDTHSGGVPLSVALGSICLNGRTSSGVENSELNTGEIGVAPDLAAEGIEFKDDVGFGNRPD